MRGTTMTTQAHADRLAAMAELQAIAYEIEHSRGRAQLERMDTACELLRNATRHVAAFASDEQCRSFETIFMPDPEFRRMFHARLRLHEKATAQEQLERFEIGIHRVRALLKELAEEELKGRQ
jgi:hypothetical protein